MKLSIVKHLQFIIFIFLFCFSNVIFAQVNTNPPPIEQLKLFTEDIYGIDDVLANGKIYRQLHSGTNSHPFYNEDSWQVGSILINGKYFENVLLKYDLELDQVIIRNMLPSGTFTHILLSEKQVDEFTIGTHHFIKATKLSDDESMDGYVELVHKQEPYFFIKYKKTYNPTSNKVFYEKKPLCFLCVNGHLKRVSNRKAFIGFFSPYEKEIRQYFNIHNIDYNNATISELDGLVTFSQQFLTTQNE